MFHVQIALWQLSQDLIFVSQVCVPNFIPIVLFLLRKLRWGFFLLLFAKVKSTPSPRPKTGVWQYSWPHKIIRLMAKIYLNGLSKRRFFAAMSSSRSVSLSVFVHWFVRKFVHNHRWFLKPIELQWLFKKASRVFHGNFKSVSRMPRGCFIENWRVKVLRVFQRSTKDVSSKLQMCLKEVLMVFQESFKVVSR